MQRSITEEHPRTQPGTVCILRFPKHVSPPAPFAGFTCDPSEYLIHVPLENVRLAEAVIPMGASGDLRDLHSGSTTVLPVWRSRVAVAPRDDGSDGQHRT